MNPQQYAEAILAASNGKRDEELDRIATRTMEVLSMHGHVGLLPAIVQELEKRLRKTKQHTECLIRVANALDAEKRQSEIASDIETLNASSMPQRTVIDETLIGGHEVRAHGKQIDRTYKRALLQLYNTLLT